MISRFENYDYSRKYLFIEDEDNNFRKELDGTEIRNNQEFQWRFVDSISRKLHKGITYDLIQHDDQILGWIEINESIQVYRFSQRHCKVIDEDYFDNEINSKMNEIRNLKLLFKDKILTARCEIIYNDELYYGIFYNNQFQGFHHEKYIDFLLPTDKIIEHNLNELSLFKISNLTGPVELKLKSSNVHLFGVFPKLKIGKVKVSNHKKTLWIDLTNLENPIIVERKETDEEKELNDIFEYIKFEREKSKAIVNKVLEVKEYIQENKI